MWRGKRKTGFEVGTFSVDTKEPSNKREYKGMVQIGAGPDLANFNASVTPVNGFMLGRKKRPDKGLRYLV
ncbi:MAG: hypothetical protein DCC43_07285 [Candidatus Brocadia sp.]|nr:MAG: hypothetical protein DCC43_07285 [Candidatus Brocadia sp.]